MFWDFQVLAYKWDSTTQAFWQSSYTFNFFTLQTNSEQLNLISSTIVHVIWYSLITFRYPRWCIFHISAYPFPWPCKHLYLQCFGVYSFRACLRKKYLSGFHFGPRITLFCLNFWSGSSFLNEISFFFISLHCFYMPKIKTYLANVLLHLGAYP